MTTTSPIRRLVLVPAAPAPPRAGVRRMLLVRPSEALGPELLPAKAHGAPTRGVRAP